MRELYGHDVRPSSPFLRARMSNGSAHTEILDAARVPDVVVVREEHPAGPAALGRRAPQRFPRARAREGDASCARGGEILACRVCSKGVRNHNGWVSKGSLLGLVKTGPAMMSPYLTAPLTTRSGRKDDGRSGIRPLLPATTGLRDLLPRIKPTSKTGPSSSSRPRHLTCHIHRLTTTSNAAVPPRRTQLRAIKSRPFRTDALPKQP